MISSEKKRERERKREKEKKSTKTPLFFACGEKKRPPELEYSRDKQVNERECVFVPSSSQKKNNNVKKIKK